MCVGALMQRIGRQALMEGLLFIVNARARDDDFD
jgi:hypothetical protein